MFDHGRRRDFESLPHSGSIHESGKPEGRLSGMLSQAEAQIGPMLVGADQFRGRLFQLQELRAQRGNVL